MDSVPSVHRFIKWTEDKIPDFAWLVDEHVYSLTKLFRKLSDTNSVNNAVEELTRVLYNSAKSVFGKTVLIHDKQSARV